MGNGERGVGGWEDVYLGKGRRWDKTGRQSAGRREEREEEHDPEVSGYLAPPCKISAFPLINGRSLEGSEQRGAGGRRLQRSPGVRMERPGAEAGRRRTGTPVGR